MDNVKPVTAYQAECPTGDGWLSNVCINEEDAQASLNDHMLTEHPSEAPVEEVTSG